MNTKINGATNSQPFNSNIGTPQGDCLSPVLFAIYMEHALKEVRKAIPETHSMFEANNPSEIIYTDDIDFVSQSPIDINTIQNTLKKYNLKVNVPLYNRVDSRFYHSTVVF